MYEVAKKMYLNGISLRKIEKEIGFDRKKLSLMLKKENIKVIPRGFTKGTQKYNHNVYAFKKIDNEEKAYWLGFLIADGNVYQPRGVIELGLSAKDKQHLEKFRDFISPSCPIKEKIIKLNDDTFLSNRIQVFSKEIVDDLIKLGCIPNKSLVVQFPKNNIIPENLVHHFIRGYFDGDGSAILRKEKTSRDQAVIFIIGNKDFLKDLVLHIGKAGISTDSRYYKKGKAYSYHISGNKNYQKFHQYIYKDATIYLERKKLPVAHTKSGELLETLT